MEEEGTPEDTQEGMLEVMRAGIQRNMLEVMVAIERAFREKCDVSWLSQIQLQLESRMTSIG